MPYAYAYCSCDYPVTGWQGGCTCPPRYKSKSDNNSPPPQSAPNTSDGDDE